MTDSETESTAEIAAQAEAKMAGLLADLDTPHGRGVDPDGRGAVGWLLSRLYANPRYATWMTQGFERAKGQRGRSLADALGIAADG